LLHTILEELDGLLARGIEYVYFIDEIFLPNRPPLEALIPRKVKFGVQTRIDLWSMEMIELLGRAGCASVDAGVECITEEGRALPIPRRSGPPHFALRHPDPEELAGRVGPQ
jgi:anaerobic magnesium-protoporphyrin IX monomethyl ester cyclase